MKHLFLCMQIILIILMLFLIVACGSTPFVSPENGALIKQINSPPATPFTKVITKVTKGVTLVPTTPPPTSTSTATPIPTNIILETPTPSPIAPIIYPTTTWNPPQDMPTDATNDWLTYVDEEAGYSFKYPPGVSKISSGSRPDRKFELVSFSLPNSDQSHPHVAIFVYENAENLTLEQYFIEKYIDSTKQHNVPPEYLATMERLEINGYPAIWNKADAASEVFVAISAERKIFNVMIVNAIMVDDMRQVSDIDKDIFYQILNSFTPTRK